MSKENSPMYANGVNDGRRDNWMISACPSQEPYGPDPPNPAYPVMYLHGYRDTYDPSKRHYCTSKCRSRAC